MTVPAAHAPEVDGRDLGPLLRDGGDGLADRVLGWHQPHQWGAPGPGIEPYTAVRVGTEKLLYFHAGRRFELYDLAADIGETRDLAAERPERVRALAASMQRWLDERGAQPSLDRVTGQPIEGPRDAADRLP